MTTILFRVIDLETTGMSPPEEIIEIGWSDVWWDVEEKVASVAKPQSALFSATRRITADNRAVHHLKDADLAPFPVCDAEALRTIARLGEPFAFVAANADFERQWLTPEIVGGAHWICTVKAAARLYPDAPSHSNQAMRYQLGLDLPDEWAMPPHRAAPDAYVTASILAAFLQQARVSDLVRWTKEPRHLPTCPKGKEWRGKPWAAVDGGFLKWLLDTPDMDADTAHAARLELDRRAVAYPRAEAIAAAFTTMAMEAAHGA